MRAMRQRRAHSGRKTIADALPAWSADELMELFDGP